MHVDDFIDGGYSKNKYARFVLNLFRLPAALSLDFAEWIKPHRLYCTYEGKRFRCVGASRLGDVWLHEDLFSDDDRRQPFYQLRVDVETCSEWGPKPTPRTEPTP